MSYGALPEGAEFADEDVMDGEGYGRQDYGNGNKPEGGAVVASLQVGKDGKGEGLGEAGDVAGDDDGRAELAEAPGEAEDGGGGHAAIGQGKGDGHHGAEGASPKAAGCFFQAGVDAGEGDFHRADHKGEGDETGGETGGNPGEEQFDAKGPIQEAADDAVSGEEEKEGVAGDDGRESKGEGYEDFQGEFAAHLGLDQCPGDGEGYGESQQHAEGGGLEGETEGLDFSGGEQWRFSFG